MNHLMLKIIDIVLHQNVAVDVRVFQTRLHFNHIWYVNVYIFDDRTINNHHEII